MLIKMMKKDFLRKKSINLTLFFFIMLSALLVASGSNMIVELSNSLSTLLVKSNTPHFVQMHAGQMSQSEVDAFTADNQHVKSQQTVEMININGSNLYLGNSPTAENSSVMDNYFIRQNDLFDFLLDLESEVIHLASGEIAVPIYYMQKNNLEIGDKVGIADDHFEMEFTIADFVRDAQMNPSIINSKRFVVSDEDFQMLHHNFEETEYLIEFLLTDLKQLSDFRNAYQSAELPMAGPSVDFQLFQTLNALTDGIVAVVIILVSLLLSLIAILCIRFTLLAAMEEDYREIGIMKAIGIEQKAIKQLYLFKYVMMAAIASITGYLLSLLVSPLFTGNIMMYLGRAEKRALFNIIPLLSIVLIFLIVVLYCMLILRRFNRITVVKALRSGNIGDAQTNVGRLALSKNRFADINIFLGLKDIYQRFKLYLLLFIVFIICAFIIIVPVNLLNTIQSPSFSTYMGIEKSDIRIDLQLSDNIEQDFSKIMDYIANDPDVEQFSPLVTSMYQFINSDGVPEKMAIETGDYSIFPLEYVDGNPPLNENEIALSYLNSSELSKKIGDDLTLMLEGEAREMTVSGIFQDVTNGGRTAKAVLPVNEDAALWYEVSLNLKQGVSMKEKMEEYTNALYPAKVTNLEGYLTDTFGNTIDQLKLITLLAVIIALFIAVLITALFMQMLIAKDSQQIAIMKSLGFTLNNIRMQYATRALFVLLIGIILGTVIANTIGEQFVSMLMSLMGASQIEFVSDPVLAYLVFPILLMIVVSITTLLSITAIKNASIAEMRA